MQQFITRLVIGAIASLGIASPAWTADKRHTVVMTHQLDDARAAKLADLVAHFNESDKRYQIELKPVAVAGSEQPTLMVLEGEGEEALRQSKQFQPMHQVMSGSGVTLARTGPRDAGIGLTVDSRGRRLALPIGMHTPVLFFNQDAFRAVGLDPSAPPRTWQSLQDALGKLFDAGYACPYTVARPSWVMLDNVSARQNEGVTRVVKGRSEELNVNGMLQIRHVALMASWVRARYLHVFDSNAEAEGRFARGECAVIAGSSASWPTLHQSAGFGVGVGQLPYYDDHGQVGGTLADGASLWAASKRSRDDYRAAASFVRFMLKPENQLAWQRGTGYLPLDAKGLVTADAVAADQPNLQIASEQLKLNDAKAKSVGLSELPRKAKVRAILDEELAAVWADVKPAKQALDTAVVRASSVR